MWAVAAGYRDSFHIVIGLIAASQFKLDIISCSDQYIIGKAAFNMASSCYLGRSLPLSAEGISVASPVSVKLIETDNDSCGNISVVGSVQPVALLFCVLETIILVLWQGCIEKGVECELPF